MPLPAAAAAVLLFVNTAKIEEEAVWLACEDVVDTLPAEATPVAFVTVPLIVEVVVYVMYESRSTPSPPVWAGLY